MNLEQIKKILERYNEGQSTAGEAQLIEEWLEHIQQSTSLSETHIQQDLADVQQALNKKLHTAKRRTLRPWYYAAAAIAMLVAAGSWFFQHRSKPEIASGEASPVAKITNSKELLNGYYIITTVKGSKETLRLEDGSTVVINAGSRLRYPEHFTGSRDIFLEEGEAWFDVAPNPSKNFTVHSGEVSTTALGTTFNIRNYHNEQKITVALLSGKVKVTSPSSKPLVLGSSEQASFDKQSLQLIKSAFATEEAIGWQQGNLIFKDASYDQVRNAIENTFAVTIINQSDKKAWTYTGNFRQESLQNVLETICLTESLTYSITRDTVFLKNKN